MNNALQISHQRKAEMSKGQQLLLETMVRCVKNEVNLQFEDVVIAYYLGVKKTLFWTNYKMDNGVMYPSGPHREYDILSEYEQKSYLWNKKIKDLIKSWFVSAIGLLVIKGWLKVLPVIEIE